jgi:hypothetical protein
MERKSPYFLAIEAQLKKMGKNHNPRHVEAYMRCEHSTLNGLSLPRFNKAIKVAVSQLEADNDVEFAETVAKSYGL